MITNKSKSMIIQYRIKDENFDSLIKKVVEITYEHRLIGRNVLVKHWEDLRPEEPQGYIEVLFPEGIEDDKQMD